jgi:hypothetical protein
LARSLASEADLSASPLSPDACGDHDLSAPEFFSMPRELFFIPDILTLKGRTGVDALRIGGFSDDISMTASRLERASHRLAI